MVDHFALFGEPRRLWLDTDALKQKFHTLAGEAHPDRVHSADESTKAAAARRYAALAAAYQVLGNPRALLGHWLELERGAKPPPLQSIPLPLQDLLFEVGRILRAADELVREKSKISSPLLQVQFFARSQAHIEKLKATLQAIETQRAALMAEVKKLDAEFFGEPSADQKAECTTIPWPRIEEIYHSLGFLARSTEQLRERLVQIGF